MSPLVRGAGAHGRYRPRMTQLGAGRAFKQWSAAVALLASTLVTTGAVAQAGFSIMGGCNEPLRVAWPA